MHRLLKKKALDAVNEALLTPSDYPGADPDYANPWFFKGTEPEEIKTGAAVKFENFDSWQEARREFLHGECHVLTFALVELTGWRCFLLVVDGFPDHSYVTTPDDIPVDASGKTTVEAMYRRYAIKKGEGQVVPTTIETLALLGDGSNSIDYADAVVYARALLTRIGMPQPKQSRFKGYSRIAQVELHESPDKLPPRTELRTRLDEDVQDEIDEEKPEYVHISRLLRPKK